MSTLKRWAAPFAAGALGAGLFFAGMYVARATPGGPVRRALSFSGTLSGRTGSQSLTFTFRKGSASVCAPMVTTTPDASTGAFTVEIPLDACPASLFDGSDVTVEVSVGGMVVSPAQPINPVPYAVYAERVGTPDCPNGYERATDATLPAGAVLCRKGLDEVVKVGTGRTAFWMDRYHNSLWTDETGSTRVDDINTRMNSFGVPTMPVVTLSRRGVLATGRVNFLQANMLCRAAGKRLPLIEESLLSIQGTPGLQLPGMSFPPRPDECPGAMGTIAYATGAAPDCQSRWGIDQPLWYWRNIPSASSVYGQASSSGSITSHVAGLIFYASPTTGTRFDVSHLVTGTGSVTIGPGGVETAIRCVIPQ